MEEKERERSRKEGKEMRKEGREGKEMRKEGREGKEMRKRDQNTSVDDYWWAWHNAGFSSCVQRWI